MKHLLPPTLAVILSTVGTAYGCHLAGMPSRHVAIAALIAGSLSSIVAFGTVALVSLWRTTPPRTNPAPRR